MKKILIIGGTGTISSWITRHFAQDPLCDVYVMNRGRKNDQLPQNVSVLIADINQKDQVEAAIQSHRFDSVINFVLFTPDQARQNIELFRKKTDQFIFISTVATLNHEGHLLLSETTPQGNEYSEYGRNKEACEKVFLEAYRSEGFPVTIVRPSQTYGEDRIPVSIKGKTCWSVIDRMIKGKEVIIHGEGQSVWVSTHAQDFAKGFVGLVANRKTIGQTYQIMSDNAHTWDDIYLELARLLKVEYRPVYIPSDILAKSTAYDLLTSIQGDKHFSCLYDTRKIKEMFPDFLCEIDIQAGLKLYLDYMEEHPELKQEDPAFDVWCDKLINRYKEATENLMENL